MTPTVFLIGTSHAYPYQFGVGAVPDVIKCSPENAVLFRDILISACEQHQIRSIGEEMSIDALSKNKRAESIPRIIAASLALPHRYCDPSLAEQENLGVCDEAAIKIGGLWAAKTSDEIEQEIIANRRKREPYWLNQLHHLNTWPALFVCGAWHGCCLLH